MAQVPQTQRTEQAPAIPGPGPAMLPTSSRWLLKRLGELHRRLAMPCSAEAVWCQMLADQQRAHLGQDLAEAVNRYGWNAARLYQVATGVSPGVAALEVSLAQGMMAAGEYKSLRRELDACEGRNGGQRRPSWDAAAELLVKEIEQAAVNCDLVVVAGDTVRAVYWSGELLVVRWGKHAKSWELVLKLARARQQGAVLDAEDVEEDATGSMISKRKHNLKRLLHLPEDFLKCIKVQTDKRTRVHLEIPKSQVRVFEVGARITSADELPR